MVSAAESLLRIPRPRIFSALISPTGRNSNASGSLGQRVDELRDDNLHLIHFALQEQVAGKLGDRPRFGKPRRVRVR